MAIPCELVYVDAQCGNCGGSGLSVFMGEWVDCIYCNSTGGYLKPVHVTQFDIETLTQVQWFSEEDDAIVQREITRRLLAEIE